MKSSIHIQPVKSTSEKHNKREQDLNYVRKDLSHENSSTFIATIRETREKIEQKYKKSTGQKMQAKSTPIREGVLLIKKEHSANDLKELGDKLEKRFGIKTIQTYAHKDEGHYDKITNEWKPNYHAHMVFDWTDENGKSLKLSKEDMSEMQTMVANHLGMERGQTSTKKHIDSITYKAIKVEQDLGKVLGVEKAIPEAINIIKQSKTTQKEIEALKEAKNGLEKEIKELDTKTQLTRANLNYLENKTEKQTIELRELEKQTELKQNSNRGMSR